MPLRIPPPLASQQAVASRNNRKATERKAADEILALVFDNETGAEVASGDVVIIDSSNERAVKFAAAKGDPNPVVVYMGGLNEESIRCVNAGVIVRIICDGDAIVPGDLIVASATNKYGTKITAASFEDVLGRAVSSKAGAVTAEVQVLLSPSGWTYASTLPGGTHDLLSATHPDTLAAAVSQGSLIVGNATPKWAELTVGANERYLGSDGTDATWVQVDHSHLSGVGVDDHHSEVHVVNSGGPHAEGGLAVGHVLLASGAAAFSFAQLQHGDLGGVGAADHQPVVTIGAALGTNLLGLAGQALSLDTQADNLVFAGPNGGGPLAPTFRALVAADLPAIGFHWTRTGATLHSTNANDDVVPGGGSGTIGSALDPWAIGYFGNISSYIDAATIVPQVLVQQDHASGDAAIEFLFTGGQAWTIGIDTDVSNAFVIAAGQNLAANPVVFILPSGYLGLGTDAPGGALDVHTAAAVAVGTFLNTANRAFVIVEGGTGATGQVASLGLHNLQSTTTWYVNHETDNRFNIEYGTSEFFTILTTGLIGAGIIAPLTNFHLYEDAASVVPQVLIEQDHASGDASLGYILSGGQAWTTGIDNSVTDAFIIAAGVDLATNPYVTVLPTGEFGLGTTAPGELFHIESGKYLQRTDADVTSVFRINDSGNTLKYRIDLDGGDATVQLRDNANVYTVALRSNGDSYLIGGDFGLGLINPTNLLHVDETDAAANVIAYFRGSNAAYQRISIDNASANTDTQVSFLEGGVTKWSIGNDATGDQFRIGTGFGSFGASIKLTIESGGHVGINKTNPLTFLHVDQDSTTAAIPVAIFDQADISEGVVNLIASARGVITGATNSLDSVRVELNNVVYRIALYLDG